MQHNDAIQQDVSAASDVPADDFNPQSFASGRRSDAMEAIGAARMEAIAEEMGVPVDVLEPEAPAEPATADQQKAGTADADGGEDSQLSAMNQIDAQTGQVLKETDGVRVKVKINGVESEVQLADVIRRYQKDSAADSRLEEATRLLREAEARAAEAATGNGKTTAQAGDDDEATPVEDSTSAGDEVVSDVKKVFSKLYEGDEDGAAQLLVGLLNGTGGSSPTQAIDLDQIAAATEQRLAVKSAFAMLQSDYPDIISDPDLDFLCARKTQAKETAGMSRSEAMLAAAQEVYELVGKKSPGRPNDNPERTTRDTKLARKAGLDRINPASASAASTTTQDELVSPSALIAQMAANRLGNGVRRS